MQYRIDQSYVYAPARAVRIERAWYNYAIQSLDPEESLTAAHAEDEGYLYKSPPFRFWVPSAVWAPSR